MQRYHATSTTSAVNNNAIGGRSSKDSSRSEASSLTSNFPLNSRRQILVNPYKLRCEKETLNSRTTKSIRGFTVFDQQVAQNLQNDLDCMTLPDTIRWRIQTALPVLFPSFRCSISCQLPFISASALAALQPCISISELLPGNINLAQRNPVASPRGTTHGAGKSKPSALQQDCGMEIDPWYLLEEGTESGSSSSHTLVIGGSDQAKSSTWLMGDVRVRRMDLTYIGSVDEDS